MEAAPTRFLRYPEAAVVLPLRLFAPVGWWVLAGACGSVRVSAGQRYDKREKATHRFTVADVNGPIDITVPVGKPRGYTSGRIATWADIPLSDHGHWWTTAATNLASGYGNSPFYDYYIDRLAPFFSRDTVERFSSVADLCTASTQAVAAILGIEGRMEYGGARTDGDATPLTADLPRYYQVREQQLGFLPGLSILDLIFNLGPEAPLYLRSVSVSGLS